MGLGIVEGALAEARDLNKKVPASRLPGADPDLLLTYGELASAAQTAIAVVDRATDAMAQALHSGPHIDPEEPAAVAALVATAETVMAKAALHVTTRVLELADAPGLDRFWRNARVLTAHDSAAHRLRSIGDHYLNGTPGAAVPGHWSM
ncbi:acyl-CoA dehydrogenase family protein [Streptomyces peucetius]